MAGTYDHYCAVAAALDVVGDRWTLLVVRELLNGPRRYSDLVEDMPGVATNLLAARLRDLEAAGLVVRVPAADRRVRSYELSDAGRRLRPVVDALAAVGLGLLPDDAGAFSFRTGWLVLPARLLLRRETLDGPLVVRLETGDGPPLQIRLDRTGASVDQETEPDVVVAGDPAAVLGVLRDPAGVPANVAAGRLRISGDRQACERLATAFGEGQPARPR
jgi:DNA-binding HxlR family transcriptional regulator